MQDFLKRLTSRKFLLTVAGVLTALANGEVLAALGLILAYMGVEGANDVVRSNKVK